MNLSESEISECQKQLIENYQSHANSLKRLSADFIDEIQLKATIRNDIDQMIVAELANS